jgi:hypothetical protein
LNPFARHENYCPRFGIESCWIIVFVLLLTAGQCALAQQLCPPGYPCPVLTAVSPTEVTAGVRQQRLVITGSNFVPGSRVLISIPNSDPTLSTPDVALASTTFVNSSTLIITIDVNRLASGMRTIDVYNPTNGSEIPNTGIIFTDENGPASFTARQIFINNANSLSGSLQVQNILLTYPRDGSILQENGEMYGEAVVAGAGTGMATGFWLWDGNPIEQFTVNLLGGESTTLRTSNPLPTAYTGPHTLQVQITTPQSMQSHPVQVVVNGGDWNVLRLLTPRLGQVYGETIEPVLRWTPVPGASKYQVGFSTSPHFDQVLDWQETNDSSWRIPNELWKKLPDGELYWTVRSVDMSGIIRKPAPMRSLWHMPTGALQASRTEPRSSRRGSLLLEWNALRAKVLYLVNVSSDPDGTTVLRRYLTDLSEADLYALQSSLTPGQTYYWQVEAVTPEHRSIMTGPRQTFTLPTQARAGRPSLQPASLSIGPIALGDTLQIATLAPAPGATVNSSQPRCEIAFEGAVDPNVIALSVDGVDVTAMAELSANQVKYNPVFPLENGDHTIQVDVQPDSKNWKFNVAASAPPAETATAAVNNDAEVGKAAEGVPQTSDVGPQFKSHFGVDPQFGFKPSPNQVTMAGGEQLVFHQGDWKVDFNGSGMLQAAITPDPDRVFGRVQDYVGQLDYSHSGWGAGARFGLLAPSLYTDAQFITTATARQAFEPKLVSPGGTVRYYANTTDIGIGGGDLSSYHQLIRGAGYEAPIPVKWATLRAMWMNARDIIPVVGATSTALDIQTVSMAGSLLALNPTAITPPLASGDMYGGLLNLHFPGHFELSSEYAISQTSPDVARNTVAQYPLNIITSPLDCTFDPSQPPHDLIRFPENCAAVPHSIRIFGRAWRSSVDWNYKKTRLNVAYRDVTPQFSNPANPGVTPMGRANRRGLDSSFSQGTPIGDFDLAYQYIESNVNVAATPSTRMHNVRWGWRKNFKSKTQLLLRGHDAITNSGDLPVTLRGVDRVSLGEQRYIIDQRDIGFNSSLLQGLGPLNVSATVSRDWFRNSIIFGQNAIVTGTQFGVNSRRISFFQLQSSWSVNWAVRDKSTQGATRIASLYLLPTIWLPETPMSFSPLVSITKTSGHLGDGAAIADVLSSQLGGRMSWKLPSLLRHATISLEGSRVEFRDNLHTLLPGTNLVDRRIGIALSLAQDHTQGAL